MRWYEVISFVVILAVYFTVPVKVRATVNSTKADNNSYTERDVCPKSITIHSKPYFETYLKIFRNGNTSGILPPLLVENVSSVCCDGQDLSIKFVTETTGISVQKLLFLEQKRREKAKIFDNTSLDFYFPAYTTKSDASIVYKEFYFIEVMKSPGPAFIMLIEELKEAPDPSIVLIECWPIFVLLLVMAWVVGIIGWFLDRTKNKDFPESFYHGSWVGFWWAVVTMTTVGYGDKAPKSFLARLLTVLWMMTGTIVISLFTANVTTVLTTKNVAELQNVLGQKVGVINSKHFFQREINEGASFIEYRDEASLLDAFHKKQISRVLVPNYLDHLYFTTTQNLKQDFVIANVIKHPFSIGLGLPDHTKHLNDELKEFLRCWERTIINNFEESGLDYSIIDPGLYHTAEDARSLLNQNSILNLIYGLIALLFVFFVSGSLWELWKYLHSEGKMNVMDQSEIEMTKRHSPTLSFR